MEGSTLDRGESRVLSYKKDARRMGSMAMAFAIIFNLLMVAITVVCMLAVVLLCIRFLGKK